MYRCDGDKNYRMCSKSLSPWKSVMVNPLSWYFSLTCFIIDIISYLPLLLHACTGLKSIFLDFLCRRGISFTKKNPYIFPHCDDVWQWEEVRVSLGLSIVAMIPLEWLCLV